MKKVKPFLLWLLLVLSACGGGKKEEPTPTVPQDTTPKIVALSGNLSDLLNQKPALLSINQRQEILRKWSDTEVQVISADGKILGTTTANTEGFFSLTIPVGSKYFVKATLGNVVIKAFLPEITSDLHMDLDPESDAIVKVLCQSLGNENCGEPGVDVSPSFINVDIPKTLSTINSHPNLAPLTETIVKEISSILTPGPTNPPPVESEGNSLAWGITNEIHGFNKIKIGGTVTGLSGELIIQNNNGSNLTISEEGEFVFPKGLGYNTLYNVEIVSYPEPQICTLKNAKGLATRINVTNVTITCVARVIPQNVPPLANAGTNQTILAGAPVTLDGTNSSDPEGETLAYFWFFTSRPIGSQATFLDSSVPTPTFTVDLPGIFEVSLQVNDGSIDSDPESLTITGFNTAPVAVAGPDKGGSAGITIPLDGGGSNDPDHPETDNLRYSWSITSRPGDSSVTLLGKTSPTTLFTGDMDGEYEITLIVNDGFVDSAPDTVTVILGAVNQAAKWDEGVWDQGLLGF